MKSRHLRSTRGVTLVEMLVAIFISSLVMAAMVGVFVNSAKDYNRNRQTSQSQMRSYLSADFISQEMRNAGYIVNWDTNPDAPPLAVNAAITGATPDLGTDTLTLRYAIGPFTDPLAVTTLGANAALGATALTVGALDINGDGTDDITPGTMIVLYQVPATVEVHLILGTVAPNQITLASGIRNTDGVPIGSIVAIVRETSFWTEGGNLMIRTDGVNQQLAANVEDLQAVLITKSGGMTGDGDTTNDGTDDTGTSYGDNPSFGSLSASQRQDVRALRLSVTGRSDQLLQKKTATVPPSLEDHDRSGEAADQFDRQIQQFTVKVRNFGL